MNSELLQISTSIQISKPAHQVFEAIADPIKMSNYFISESSGRMEEGKTLTWKFPEFETTFPVKVHKVKEDAFISFYWEGADGHELLVEVELKSLKNDCTLVTVSESGMPNNEEGIKWLKNNTAGWANFLACLKAYLEYGINLRKGGFDFLIDQ